MNIDIRLSIGFFDHPKTIKLQKRCGIEAVLCLQRLWLWAASNRPSGVLFGVDEEDIEIAAKWTGEDGKFIRTLEELHWIDWSHDPACEADGCWVLHGWEEHQAYACKSEERREKAKKAINARWEKQREQQQNTDSNTPSIPSVDIENTPKHQDTNTPKHQVNTPLSPKGDFPPQGDSGKGKILPKKKNETIVSVLNEQPQELIPVLTEFVNHRKNIKKPLTAHALRLNIAALQRLAPDDIERQIHIAEHSIMKGWQGFYLPEEERGHSGVTKVMTVSQQRSRERQIMAQMLLSEPRREDGNGIGNAALLDGSQFALSAGRQIPGGTDDYRP